MKQLFAILLLTFGLSGLVIAQNGDDVLFSVAGTPVTVDEFDYIYSKTNGNNADYSRKSLEEYLDLYIKFKLKVQKAHDLKLDTIPALKEELAGYRRQLADAYLIDRTVTDKLVQEAYERIQQDVDISHILVSVAPDASPADTMAAYQKIMTAKQQLSTGGSFETIAKSVSDDKSAQRNGGHIGFVTALFPKGLYQLETVAYTGPLNQLLGPIRSDAGYHLLKIHSRRPARGEMEAAHILLRVKDGNDAAVKKQMDSMRRTLEDGADFEQLAREHSEDRATANEGGYIGFFGINRYEPVFEDAAFAIENDGDISPVVKSNIGYHLIKRISRKTIQPFEVEKGRLEARISQDPRFEIAKTAMLNRIKMENDFKESAKVLNTFAQMQTDTFLTFRWKAPAKPSKETLFSLDDYKVTLGDFTDWLTRASRKRLRMGGGSSDVQAAVQSLYADFVNEKLMEFEETQLEERYPEFKALMREYREGILLFEATKMLVWDKAGQDTLGLRKFYDTIRGKYRWGDRVRTSVYEVHSKHKDMLTDIRNFAAENTPEEVLAKYNTPENKILKYEEFTYEKNRNVPPPMASAKWEAGTLSANEPTRLNTLKFYKFEEVMPPTTKTLQEARGYVVADYQDYLEKQWVEELKNEYRVKVNRKVFDSLIKE
ncbi:peptidylprolyl isomerase [Flavilitoribacter nigricans]|uniref:peptidylprolyl isomerase n=1 Tax=Flavilitoribacter nigricans TaxID=70997 RepID=UPI00147517EF|nr:peptidylprolyl isomerase [Flavilitoribacter nigricans]